MVSNKITEKRINPFFTFRPQKVLALSICISIAAAVFLRLFVSGIVFPRYNHAFFIGWFCILILVFFESITRKTDFYVDLPAIFLLGFLVIALISKHFSIVPWKARSLMVNLVTWIIIYLSISNFFRGERKIENILYVLMTAAVLVALYGLYQYFFGLQETRDWLVETGQIKHMPEKLISRLSGNRTFSFFIYPNALAGFFVLTIPVIISLTLKSIINRKIARYCYFICVSACITLGFLIFVKNTLLFFPALGGIILSPLLCLVSFYLTFSKGGLVAFAAVILFFISFSLLFLKDKKIKLFSFVSAIIIILLITFFSIGLYKVKGDKLGSPVASALARINYWPPGIKMLEESPLIGVGPGVFGSIYPRYKLPHGEETQMAHNDYLQILAETGLLGFCFYIGCILTIFLSMARKIKCSDLRDGENILLFAIFIGFFGILVHSFFEFVLYVPGISSTMFFFAAIVLAKSKVPSVRFPVERKWYVSGVIILAILIGFALCYRYSKAIVDSDELYKQAIAVVQEKKLSAGLKLINRAIDVDPDNPQLWHFRGVVSEELRNYEKALVSYKKASELEPSMAFYHFLVAKGIKNQYADAGQSIPMYEIEKELKIAVEAYPTKGFYYLQLGLFYDMLDRSQEAIANLNKALEFDPELKEAREAIRRVKLKKKKLDAD